MLLSGWLITLAGGLTIEISLILLCAGVPAETITLAVLIGMGLVAVGATLLLLSGRGK